MQRDPIPGRPGMPRRSEHYPRHKGHEIIWAFALRYAFPFFRRKASDCIRIQDLKRVCENWREGKETAGPSTSLPDFLWRLVASANFMRLLYGKAHRRACPVLRGRKSGYASVGMTILFRCQNLDLKINLSSRPERSEVEGPAVSFPSASSHTPCKVPMIGLRFCRG